MEMEWEENLSMVRRLLMRTSNSSILVQVRASLVFCVYIVIDSFPVGGFNLINCFPFSQGSYQWQTLVKTPTDHSFSSQL